MFRWLPKNQLHNQAELVEMEESPNERKKRWIIAVLSSVVIGGSGLSLFRTPEHHPADGLTKSKPKTVALIGGADRAISDEAALLDPTPLFLPTRWNASQRELVAPEIGGRYQGFDSPKFSFAETEVKLGLPPPVRMPAGPGDIVSADAWSAGLVGFGRPAARTVSLVRRSAFFEVVRAADGKKVFTQSISEPLPTRGAWQPVEFAAGVDSAGLVGPLTVTVRSGIEEVDSFLSNQLVKTHRIGERLAPGFYRIFVGP